MPFTKRPLKCTFPDNMMIAGGFCPGVTGVASSVTKTITAGDALLFTADSTGTAYNATGGVVLTEVNGSSLRWTLATGKYVDFIRQASGEAAAVKNSWQVVVSPGASELITQDATGKILYCVYNASTSTHTTLAAAVAAVTNWSATSANGADVTLVAQTKLGTLSGGIADAGEAVWATTAPFLTLNFVNGVTTITNAKAAVNASATNKSFTLSSAGAAHTIVSGDAGANNTANGVSAVASTVYNCTTDGVSVSKTGTGKYTVTLPVPFASVFVARVGFMCAAATVSKPQFTAFTPASGTFVITILNATAAANPVYDADARVFFDVRVKRS